MECSATKTMPSGPSTSPSSNNTVAVCCPNYKKMARPKSVASSTSICPLVRGRRVLSSTGS
ncbi:hypothetical protein E2562_015172 [Oryza meyeriana var. granulata]|uniref:Uncharacterized protein n=1 Tax=Oryza meyeriana var. granulata TaxID=110450 RepID=A0A6G1EWQ3_9ORYZ|nr:hypothetical protein E2562_015172 [Oryza meyeriana var. granulata]